MAVQAAFASHPISATITVDGGDHNVQFDRPPTEEDIDDAANTIRQLNSHDATGASIFSSGVSPEAMRQVHDYGVSDAGVQGYGVTAIPGVPHLPAPQGSPQGPPQGSPQSQATISAPVLKQAPAGFVGNGEALGAFQQGALQAQMARLDSMYGHNPDYQAHRDDIKYSVQNLMNGMRPTDLGRFGQGASDSAESIAKRWVLGHTASSVQTYYPPGGTSLSIIDGPGERAVPGNYYQGPDLRGAAQQIGEGSTNLVMAPVDWANTHLAGGTVPTEAMRQSPTVQAVTQLPGAALAFPLGIAAPIQEAIQQGSTEPLTHGIVDLVRSANPFEIYDDNGQYIGADEQLSRAFNLALGLLGAVHGVHVLTDLAARAKGAPVHTAATIADALRQDPQVRDAAAKAGVSPDALAAALKSRPGEDDPPRAAARTAPTPPTVTPPGGAPAASAGTQSEPAQSQSASATQPEVPAPGAVKQYDQGQFNPPGSVTIRPGVAVTPDGAMQAPTVFKVVPRDSLGVSHDLNGNPNLLYPDWLQGRARSLPGEMGKIQEQARNLDPSLLLDDFRSSDRGAPVVGGDGQVESGNGRVMSLDMAKRDFPDRYQAYVDELNQRYPEAAGIPDPVLVQERLGSMDQADRMAFAAASNEGSSSQMTPVEIARNDVSLLPAGIEDRFEPVGRTLEDALASPKNRGLMQEFVAALPVSEQAAMTDSNGQFSTQARERFARAIVAHSLGGDSASILHGIFTDGDFSKTVAGGIEQAAGDLLKLRNSGEPMAHEMASTIRTALDYVDQARVAAKGGKMKAAQWFEQGALFDRDPSAMKVGKLLQEARSKEQAADVLKGLSSAARDASGGMFGDELSFKTVGDAVDAAFGDRTIATDSGERIQGEPEAPKNGPSQSEPPKKRGPKRIAANESDSPENGKTVAADPEPTPEPTTEPTTEPTKGVLTGKTQVELENDWESIEKELDAVKRRNRSKGWNRQTGAASLLPSPEEFNLYVKMAINLMDRMGIRALDAVGRVADHIKNLYGNDLAESTKQALVRHIEGLAHNNEELQSVRREMGSDAVPKADVKPDEVTRQEMQGQGLHTEESALKRADEVLRGQRNHFSDAEAMGSATALQALRAEHSRLFEEYTKDFDPKIADQMDAVRAKADRITEAGIKVGTEQGRAFRARQTAMSEEGEIVKRQRLLGGKRRLTSQEIEEAKGYVEQAQKLKEEMAQRERDLAQREAKVTQQEQQTKKRAPTRTKVEAKDRQTQIQTQIDEIGKRIQEKWSKKSSSGLGGNPQAGGLDLSGAWKFVEIVPDILELAKLHVQMGVVKAADVADRVASDLRDKFGVEGITSDHVQAILAGKVKGPDKVGEAQRTLSDWENVKKQARDEIANQEQRNTQDRETERKEREQRQTNGENPREIVKSQLESAKKRLEERLKSIEEHGFVEGDKSRNTLFRDDPELQALRAKVARLQATDNILESPKGPRSTEAAEAQAWREEDAKRKVQEDAFWKEVADRQKEWDEQQRTSKRLDRQENQARVAGSVGAERAKLLDQIDKINEKIGDIADMGIERGASSKLDPHANDPVVQRLRSERAALQDKLAALRSQPESLSPEGLRQSTRERIAGLHKQLADLQEHGFVEGAKSRLKLFQDDPELQELRMREAALRRVASQQRSLLEAEGKPDSLAMKILTTTRGIATTGDGTFVMNHGLAALYMDPKSWSSSFRAALRGASEQGFDKVEGEIRASPMFETATAAGLFEHSAALADQFGATHITKVPVAAHFERSWLAAGDALRMTMFERFADMMQGVQGSKPLTLDDYTKLSDAVKAISGQGLASKGWVGASRAFTALRFFLSHFEVASGYHIWRSDQSPALRRVLALKYAQGIATMVGAGTLANLALSHLGPRDDKGRPKAHVEMDPMSTNFGRLIYRTDGGVRTVDVFPPAARVFLQALTIFHHRSTFGKDVKGKDAVLDTIGQKWVVNKLTPLLGLAIETGTAQFRKDKTSFGKSFDFSHPAAYGNTAMGLTPFILQNMKDAVADPHLSPVEKAVAVSLPVAFITGSVEGNAPPPETMGIWAPTGPRQKDGQTVEQFKAHQKQWFDKYNDRVTRRIARDDWKSMPAAKQIERLKEISRDVTLDLKQ